LFGSYWFALGVRTAASPGLKAEAVVVRVRSQ